MTVDASHVYLIAKPFSDNFSPKAYIVHRINIILNLMNLLFQEHAI